MKLRSFLLIAICLAIVLGLSSCGGSSSARSPSTASPTPSASTSFAYLVASSVNPPYSGSGPYPAAADLADMYLFDTSTGSHTKINPQSSVFYNVHLSNDGTMLLFVAGDSAGGYHQIYLADPAYKNVTQLTTGEAGYFEATFSPDGNTIAYSAGAGKLFFIPTAGGTPTQIPLTNLFGEEPIFTPNGQSLIFAGRPATGEGPMSAIYIVNLDGSGLTQLSAGGNDQHPAISSDGTLVAFERQGYNGTAYVENIAVVGIGGEGTANPATILTTDNFSWQPMFMGSELLFISSKDNPFSGNDNIYQMNYDGSDVVRLTDTPLENCFEWGTPNNPRNR